MNAKRLVSKRISLHRAAATATLGVSIAILSGCIEGKSFVATASDYSAYRATRVGLTLEDRVSAASRYLEEHPHGLYVDDVHAYFGRAEPFFYHRAENSVAGLTTYLDLLPKGPHAERAKDALAFMRKQEGRPDDLLAAATKTRTRLEANARSRAHARGELSAWLERAMAPGVFASPFSEGPKELLIPFSLSLPEAHCSPIVPPLGEATRRCSKLQSLPYVIPLKRSYEEHELTFEVTIETNAQTRPTRVIIAGPDMFLRLQETYSKTIVPTESERRIDAVEKAVDVVTGAFEAEVSIDPKCVQDIAAPDVVHLRCHGIDVVATLAGGPDGDDVVFIKPSE